jgi:hypothetical protein
MKGNAPMEETAWMVFHAATEDLAYVMMEKRTSRSILASQEMKRSDALAA